MSGFRFSIGPHSSQPGVERKKGVGGRPTPLLLMTAVNVLLAFVISHTVAYVDEGGGPHLEMSRFRVCILSAVVSHASCNRVSVSSILACSRSSLFVFSAHGCRLLGPNDVHARGHPFLLRQQRLRQSTLHACQSRTATVCFFTREPISLIFASVLYQG